MAKEEARKKFDDIMKEYCKMVDDLERVQNTASLEKKLEMQNQRSAKLKEAEDWRTTAQLDVSKEDAMHIAQQMENESAGLLSQYHAFAAILEPEQRAEMETKILEGQFFIANYRTYHEI